MGRGGKDKFSIADGDLRLKSEFINAASVARWSAPTTSETLDRGVRAAYYGVARALETGLTKSTPF